MLLVLVLAVAYWATIVPLDRHMANRPVVVKLGYTPGPTVLRLAAGDYKPLLAEFQVLRVMFYFGSLVEKWQQRIHVAPEFANMFRTIQTAVHLDPYNKDAYYFAQAAFTWQVGHAADVNRLLDYGMRFRTRDWLLPYFAGFNAAYFLRDYNQAAEYMRRAAQLSGHPLLTNLSARYFYESGREEVGIAFLQDMVARSQDAKEKRLYQLRLAALRAIREISVALQDYHEDQGQDPDTLMELVAKGYLEKIPEDPYGGEFYLTDQGRVRTTSEMALARSATGDQQSHD